MSSHETGIIVIWIKEVNMKRVRRDKNKLYWYLGQSIRKPNYNKHSKFVSYYKAMCHSKKRAEALHKYTMLYI